MSEQDKEPPLCPLHRKPLRSCGNNGLGEEVFQCSLPAWGGGRRPCSVMIFRPLSRQPVEPDPLHTDDPAQMTDPEI